MNTHVILKGSLGVFSVETHFLVRIFIFFGRSKMESLMKTGNFSQASTCGKKLKFLENWKYIFFMIFLTSLLDWVMLHFHRPTHFFILFLENMDKNGPFNYFYLLTFKLKHFILVFTTATTTAGTPHFPLPSGKILFNAENQG